LFPHDEGISLCGQKSCIPGFIYISKKFQQKIAESSAPFFIAQCYSGRNIMNILLVEDDPVIGESLRINLEVEGHAISWAKSIAEARAAFSAKQPELIILDLTLPDGHGMTLCQELRNEKFAKPILILSAISDEESVVRGFETGANDYIRKPFSNRELIARIRSHELSMGKKSKLFQFEGLVVEPERRFASYNETPLPLNRREFDLLLLLIENPGSVVKRETILEKLSGAEEILGRTVDSHVSHLRARLKQIGIADIKIRTEYGVGYRLVSHE
jgi:two-component system OmpR family response regulator